MDDLAVGVKVASRAEGTVAAVGVGTVEVLEAQFWMCPGLQREVEAQFPLCPGLQRRRGRW